LKLERHLREFIGFWYLCATLVDVFAHKVTFEVLLELTSEVADRRDLDEFARARQSFAVDAGLAWERISEIRDAWSLECLPPPLLRSPRDAAAGMNGEERRAPGGRPPAPVSMSTSSERSTRDRGAR
jgi:hypothetical protein